MTPIRDLRLMSKNIRLNLYCMYRDKTIETIKMDNVALLIFVSMRPKQWVKNFFIFLPFIFGKKLFVFPANIKAIAAFFLFSFIAGAGYLINDIMDLDKDKIHPTKCLRPMASGKVSIRQALIAGCIIGIISAGLSFRLDIYFGLVVVSYLILHILYTKILKNLVIIDVFCIGGFFLLRIIAGSIIARVELSQWIIFMTVLLALYLGFNKRRQELNLLEKNAISHRPVLTKYNTYFIDQMIAVVTSSIVLAYMLYTVDARTVKFFGTKYLIYSIPFVYYGIFRYLYLIHKKEADGDPTQILFSDKMMQLNLGLWITVCIIVIYFGI